MKPIKGHLTYIAKIGELSAQQKTKFTLIKNCKFEIINLEMAYFEVLLF